MTVTTRSKVDHRQALIGGLRELADYLDTHPEVPFEYPEVSHHVRAQDDEQGIARVHELAELLDVPVTGTLGEALDEDTTHFYATRKFGPVRYEAVYILRQVMADHAAHMSYRTNVHAEERAA